jgi:serine/threonine protein kinase
MLTKIEPIQAFDLITSSWRRGQSTVPLFGAGLSIETGIPGTTNIGEYLAKVRYLERLTEHGWPDYNEVNREILERCRDESPDRTKRLSDHQILRIAIQRGIAMEFGEIPWVAERHRQDESSFYAVFGHWRTLLRRLSAGDPTVIDPFYDSLTRDRTPGKSHLFVASLTQLLGWRLLLTTNFDSLLEKALGESGRAPRVYELPEYGILPAPSLVRSDFAVVKLHGGRFNVRFSDVLDTAMDAAAIDRFLEYLPSRSMFLVLGYRGADRRVMSLLDGFLRRRDHSESGLPRLLWICRKEPPRQLLRLAKTIEHPETAINFANFHDTGLFLQELCIRLRSTFPPCGDSYRALTNSPPWTHTTIREQSDEDGLQSPSEEAPTSQKQKAQRTSMIKQAVAQINEAVERLSTADDEPVAREPSVIAIVGKTLGEGTSTRLAELARGHERTHRIVWCDIEEIPMVDALVTNLLNQFQHYDPQLTPIVLSRDADDPATEEDAEALHGAHDPRITRLLEALSREKYFVGIDSMGEFGRSHVGHDLSEPAINLSRKYLQLCDFMRELCARSDRMGESRIGFVLAPVVPPESNTEQAVSVPVDDEDYHRYALESETHAAHLGAGRTLAYKAPRAGRPVSLPSSIPLPESIGRYKVQRLLGSGGFAHVYLVFDEVIDTHFAAKVLRKRSGMDPRIIINEARAAITLNHPHIVRVYYVDDGDPAYILYEYIDGMSLHDHLYGSHDSGAPWDAVQCVRIVMQVARALHYAHTHAKLVHCDVKPHNILLDRQGNAKVVDFGLALRLDSDVVELGGTVPYMSPEQARAFTGADGDSAVGPLSDVYSLGVVMYELLARQLPFVAPTRDTVIKKILLESPRRLDQVAVKVPRSLAYICHKCLAKDPRERYRSARELADAIESWLSEQAAQMGEDEHVTTQRKLIRTYFGTLDQLKRLSAAKPIQLEHSQPGEYYREKHTEEALRGVLRADADIDVLCHRIVGEGNTALEALHVIWSWLRPDHQTILAIASAFRRPRSIIALRRVGALALRYGRDYILEVLREIDRDHLETYWRTLAEMNPDRVGRSERHSSSFRRRAARGGEEPSEAVSETLPESPREDHDHEADDELVARVDQILLDLEQADLLIRQEGGFYWMHTSVRDAVYRDCAQKEPQGMANLHELIAYYYYENVYRPTHDISAFYEFVCHQLYAIREAPLEHQTDRLAVLYSCLDRERSQLLSQAHPGTLLGWLRTIRQGELPRIRRPRREIAEQGPPEQRRQLRRVIARLSTFLVDVEADIHRRTTNYRSCIEIRLGQVARNTTVLSGLLESKISLNSAFILDLFSKIEDDRQHREELAEFCAHLEWRLSRVLDDKRQLERPQARQRIFRLIDHILDIAVCLQGLHWYSAARGLFEVIRQHAVNLRLPETPDEDSLASPIKAAEVAEQHDTGSLEWTVITQCRCSLRLMDSWSSQVYTWDAVDPHEDPLTLVIDYGRAIDALERYSGSMSTRYLRHNCSMKSLLARAHYLCGRYDQAYLALENARSSVYRENGTNERMALAVCELRWAECLMLHADELVSAVTQPLDERLGQAQNKLDLARSSLRHCKEILSAAKGNVWRWTLMYLEQTQLQHEELVLSFLRADDDNKERTKRQNCLDSALRTISAGLDNILKDRVRWHHFEILWWQFYLCYIFEQERQVDFDGNWEDWKAINKANSLEWFVTIQERERFPTYASSMLKPEPLDFNREDADQRRNALLDLQAIILQRRDPADA